MKRLLGFHLTVRGRSRRRLRVATSACLSLLLVLAVVTAARAELFFETKLTASDLAADDNFGESVGISGNTAVVGAHGGNSAIFDEGAAYLFDVTTGKELFKLAGSDILPGDMFGRAVAISGSTAIVGSRGRGDPDGPGSLGVAYLFDVSTGRERFKLSPSDGNLVNLFGLSVGIDGNTAIVGTGADFEVNDGFGAAYLFDVTTGEERLRLTPSDNPEEFGYAVGISGNTAIVGARSADGEERGTGAVYVFDATTGEQRFKLTASDGKFRDVFGDTVGISGNRAIVGARFQDEAGINAGAAYVFDVTTGEQLFKLTASDGEADDRFGWSVAIDGTTAIVGARLDDDGGINAGAAYLFDVISGEELAKLTASDADEADFFGSVAIDGSVSIVGAWRNDDPASNTGAAYLFHSIPEPSTLILATLALIALLMIRRPPACRGARLVR
ncbi:MAG: FG-GAP repeat protein [Planctomycetes bacterium]|nr:FG-GAP repeat protein [Planctomycetota bacterium]